jgi:hypothetical protein
MIIQRILTMIPGIQGVPAGIQVQEDPVTVVQGTVPARMTPAEAPIPVRKVLHPIPPDLSNREEDPLKKGYSGG